MSEATLWNVYVAMRIFQGLLSLVGNGVTIAAVIRSASLRSPPHLLIANLAASDFLHGLTVIIVFPLKTFLVDFPAWRIACLLLQLLESTTILTQIFSFIAVAMERVLALRSKLGISKIAWSTTFTAWLIVFMWTCIIILLLSLFLTTEKITPGLPCRMVLVFGQYFAYFSVFMLLFSTLSMLVLNGNIAKIAWDSRKRQGQMTAQRKRDVSIARMLALVTGVFFVMFSPMLFMSKTVTVNSPPWHRFVYYMFILWSDVSFWINPIIYVWRNKDFRTSIGSMFGRHFGAPRVAPGEAGQLPAPRPSPAAAAPTLEVK